MLFNSKEFILYFLPVTLVLFYLLARHMRGLALTFLLVASLAFYAYWNPVFVLLLVAAIVFNFTIGQELITPRWVRSDGLRRLMLGGAIAVNLGALAYFKYWNFFLENVASLTGGTHVVQDIFLPLGISFHTFQQIVYLVDCRRGRVPESSLRDYALFVTFFPQLIAGPIVHHGQMMPQFARPEVFRFDATSFLDGTVIFLLGLAKKVVIADYLGFYADEAFGAARSGAELSLVEAWCGGLAYTLQLYFDFSGYADMAIGLGLMFNIVLPINFDSPLRAASIIEFWRRWHMTLSAFLRDYVYVPLGGNRKGEARRNLNLMATMLIGGFWHGANWTFVIWGGLHGAFLMLNHAWLRIPGMRAAGQTRPGRLAGWLLTFLAVVLAFVMFRADSVATAIGIYRGMAGLQGATMPEMVLSLAPPLRHLFVGIDNFRHIGEGTVTGLLEVGTMVGFSLCLVLFFPNLYRMRREWRVWILVPAFALTMQKVFFARGASPFLYFQF